MSTKLELATVPASPETDVAVLPAHRRQSAAVRERFARLYERPVTLEIDGLSRSFESEGGWTTALQDVSFRAHRRELICVIGPSGCGKSTLGRLVAGLDEPTAGRIRVDGEDVQGPCPNRGMVFQGYTLFPWRTVLGNVMFGLEVSGLSALAAEQQAMPWVEMVGLASVARSYPYQLSGGMKQRVAIARALATNPRLLVMDEPFAALDAQTRSQMQEYLIQIWRQVDVTVLFVTHDLDEAVYLADRIVVMGANPGRVLEVVEVPVPRPREASQVESPAFVATKKYLETLIHSERPKDIDRLPIVRMTTVGDDVE